MWRCPKCSKVFDGDSRICRQCGAILEEVPDETLPPEREGDDFVEATEEDAKPPVVNREDAASAAESEIGPPWRCGGCFEDVPGNFDVCWNCGADQEGSQVVEAGAFRGAQTKEQAGNSLRPAPDLAPCPECQAVAVMQGLPLVNEDVPDMELKVVSSGRPQALVFKDLFFGTVRADVCGLCGYVRFRVTNPEELLAHHQESREEM